MIYPIFSLDSSNVIVFCNGVMVSGHLPSSVSTVTCFAEETDYIWSPIKDIKIEIFLAGKINSNF
jgi:hypothetical protein